MISKKDLNFIKKKLNNVINFYKIDWDRKEKYRFSDDYEPELDIPDIGWYEEVEQPPDEFWPVKPTKLRYDISIVIEDKSLIVKIFDKHEDYITNDDIDVLWRYKFYYRVDIEEIGSEFGNYRITIKLYDNENFKIENTIYLNDFNLKKVSHFLGCDFSKHLETIFHFLKDSEPKDHEFDYISWFIGNSVYEKATKKTMWVDDKTKCYIQ